MAYLQFASPANVGCQKSAKEKIPLAAISHSLAPTMEGMTDEEMARMLSEERE